jgi:hypothetical protein
MESIVRDGNEDWNKVRMTTLLEAGDTQELLRPLFCGSEINIKTGTSTNNGTAEGFASSFTLGNNIFNSRLGFGFFSASREEYDAVIRANGQRLDGLPAGNIETIFGLATIVPSDADDDYIDTLIDAGIIDNELAEDVLAVDFTRAVFSDDRCDLVNFVPNIPSDELSPESVRTAILAELGDPAPGTPAAELKNNLANLDDDIRARVSAFSDACNERADTEQLSFTDKDGKAQTMEVSSMLRDFMRVVSLNRDAARNLPVIEFPMVYPSDDQNVPLGSRLSPVDCTLTTDFVPVAEEAPVDNGGDGGTCCKVCSENSQPCGDSCIPLTSTCTKDPGCACDSSGANG